MDHLESFNISSPLHDNIDDSPSRHEHFHRHTPDGPDHKHEHQHNLAKIQCDLNLFFSIQTIVLKLRFNQYNSIWYFTVNDYQFVNVRIHRPPIS